MSTEKFENEIKKNPGFAHVIQQYCWALVAAGSYLHSLLLDVSCSLRPKVNQSLN